jgi:uncharacterized damage-inducible protein DinB
MSLDILIGSWKDVRLGFIAEVEKIPSDHFSFRATADTRSIAELIQHVVEAQKFLVGETCRANSDLRRQSFADHIKEYAPEVGSVIEQEGLLGLLRSSMDQAEANLRAYADGMQEPILRLDGRPASKIDFMNFVVSHEMYHRGQLTVYERLLGIEPELTVRLKKLFAQAGG